MDKLLFLSGLLSHYKMYKGTSCYLSSFLPFMLAMWPSQGQDSVLQLCCLSSEVIASGVSIFIESSL